MAVYVPHMCIDSGMSGPVCLYLCALDYKLDFSGLPKSPSPLRCGWWDSSVVLLLLSSHPTWRCATSMCVTPTQTHSTLHPLLLRQMLPLRILERLLDVEIILCGIHTSTLTLSSIFATKNQAIMHQNILDVSFTVLLSNLVQLDNVLWNIPHHWVQFTDCCGLHHAQCAASSLRGEQERQSLTRCIFSNCLSWLLMTDRLRMEEMRNLLQGFLCQWK